jgi:hypothetical protein
MKEQRGAGEPGCCKAHFDIVSLDYFLKYVYGFGTTAGPERCSIFAFPGHPSTGF